MILAIDTSKSQVDQACDYPLSDSLRHSGSDRHNFEQFDREIVRTRRPARDDPASVVLYQRVSIVVSRYRTSFIAARLQWRSSNIGRQSRCRWKADQIDPDTANIAECPHRRTPPVLRRMYHDMHNSLLD